MKALPLPTLVVALLVAPIAPAALVALGAGLTGEGLIALFFVPASIVTYVHAIFLGLPALMLLRHHGRLTLRWVACTGFVVGAAPLLATTAFTHLLDATKAVDTYPVFVGFLNAAALALGCGVLGLVAAFAWWGIAASRLFGNRIAEEGAVREPTNRR